MSDEPVNLAEDGQAPLYADWYAGPERADGISRRRLQLFRHEDGEQHPITLSQPEATRLLSFLIQRPR